MKKQLAYIQMGALPGWIGIAVHKDAFAREMRRLKIKAGPEFVMKDATTHLFNHPRNGDMRLVCIDKKAAHAAKRKPSEIVGLLVHEAMHCWQDVKKDMGESEPSHEMEAYAIQHIAQSLYYYFNTLPA